METLPGQAQAPRQVKSLLRELVESALIALVMALFVRTFFLQAFKIPTGSMQPTLVVGDRILVDKVTYGIPIPFTDRRLPRIRAPQRGDIVVFRAIDDPRRDFIKRLAAVGGDTVEIKEMRVWVNGRPLTDPPVFRQILYYNRGGYAAAGQTIQVPPGHYFFLGDNSASSRDSRYWGFLPESKVIGRAFAVYWPIRRIRWLK